MPDQWSHEQSKYRLATFGGGELGAGVMANSWRDIGSSTYGRLAYEQYGNLKDLGFALSQSSFGEGLDASFE